jgi:hypothetical protein
MIIHDKKNGGRFEVKHDNAAREYQTGQVIGTTQALAISQGRIHYISVADRSKAGIPLRVWFFIRKPTTFKDGDTFDMNHNDALKWAGFIDLSDYKALPSMSVCQNRIAHLEFSAIHDGKLYYTIEARSTGILTDHPLLINFGQCPE